MSMRLLEDFSVATSVALIFLLLTWLSGRALSGGGTLNSFKRGALIYGFVFVLGMGYVMLLVADMHWPKVVLFPAIGGWGCIVMLVARWRYRRQKRRQDEDLQNP